MKRYNCKLHITSDNHDRKLALQQKQKRNLRILPFVTWYQPSVLNLNSHEKLANNRTTTITDRNLQKSASSIVEKRAVELCRPMNPILPKSWIQIRIIIMAFQNLEFRILAFQVKILNSGFWPSRILNSIFWNLCGYKLRL